MKPWQKRTGEEKAYKSTKQVVRKTFLILCEDVLMEPFYFRSFPVRTAQVKAIGVFESKVALVEKAKDYIKVENPDKDCEIWLVFNYYVDPSAPSINPDDFNRAVSEAESLGYRVAWSNPAFDLWLLLHFQEVHAPLSKTESEALLGKYLDCDYAELSRKPAFCKQIYSMVEQEGSQEEAFLRAGNLLEAKSDAPPALQNPLTTVHHLVDELNQYLKP